jgi:hypothetical protein
MFGKKENDQDKITTPAPTPEEQIAALERRIAELEAKQLRPDEISIGEAVEIIDGGGTLSFAQKLYLIWDTSRANQYLSKLVFQRGRERAIATEGGVMNMDERWCTDDEKRLREEKRKQDEATSRRVSEAMRREAEELRRSGPPQKHKLVRGDAGWNQLPQAEREKSYSY